jgi:hypothetical protein
MDEVAAPASASSTSSRDGVGSSIPLLWTRDVAGRSRILQPVARCGVVACCKLGGGDGVSDRVGDAASPRWRVETRLAVLGRGEHRPGQPLNVPIVPASMPTG